MRALPPTSLSSTTLAPFQPVFVDESHPLKLNTIRHDYERVAVKE